MRLLIELPTWLGDCVMTTPAIENIISSFHDAKITFVGSSASIDVMKFHPNLEGIYEIENKPLKLFTLAKKMGNFDIFVSFRSSLSARFFRFLVNSKKKYSYNKKLLKSEHQVEKYNEFISNIFRFKNKPGKLKIFTVNKIKKEEAKKRRLGINPGATYGSAKRWYPEKFADVAKELSQDFNIIIFAGKDEIDIASDIEKILIKSGVKNYLNTAGKLDIVGLISEIQNLDLFITGDSGPMHIAAAFHVPTISIFGPTNYIETSQWMNEKSLIVRKNISCQPCMKRVCPLKHHDCMKGISSKEVLNAALSLF